MKWVCVQGASDKTITGEFKETVVDGISFLDKEASGQSTRESKRKKYQVKKECVMVSLYNFLSDRYKRDGLGF